MTLKSAIKCGIFGTVCFIVCLFVKYSKPEVERQETTYTQAVEIMPRSRNPFCMEVADIEYLVLTSTHQSEDTQSENITTSNGHNNTQPQAGMLTATGGVFNGPSGTEKWYPLPMGGVVDIMRSLGYDEARYPYWVREDGCKMLGDYIMVAANLDVRPRGTILETSRGTAIVCDKCAAAYVDDITLIDIAVSWGE